MRKLNYFSAGDACVGCGMSGEAEYPDAKSLVSHLDYLGVERSLVWSREALDVNNTRGNANLLKIISGSKEFQERLIPSFVVTPGMVYEKEGLPFLLDSLENGVRALRIFPSQSRFAIGDIETLFSKISKFGPAVFWDVKGASRTDTVEFTELARKFPEMKFAASSFMWMQQLTVFEMMRRSENIYAELSWCHITMGIETLVKLFGAERLLFGLGYKTHYGAAIAGLAHAEIPDTAKQKIAGENLQRVLGLKLFKGKVGAPPLLKEKPLWLSFREGEPVRDTEIIDAHGHSGPAAGCGININSSSVEPENFIGRIIHSLDHAGIKRIIISHLPALFGEPLEGNRELEDICAKFDKDKRILGYYGFNPFYKEALAADLDRAFSGGFFKGFKLLAGYWKVPVTDGRYNPVWEYASKHRMPILIHTWDDSYNSPVMLTDIVKKYPDAVFLLGHSGGGTHGRKEALELARNSGNVFLEFCGTFCTPLDFTDAIKEFGAGRVLFGSDMDGHDHAWELGRFLSLPLPDAELKPALAGNIKRILSGIK